MKPLKPGATPGEVVARINAIERDMNAAADSMEGAIGVVDEISEIVNTILKLVKADEAQITPEFLDEMEKLVTPHDTRCDDCVCGSEDGVEPCSCGPQEACSNCPDEANERCSDDFCSVDAAGCPLECSIEFATKAALNCLGRAADDGDTLAAFAVVDLLVTSAGTL